MKKVDGRDGGGRDGPDGGGYMRRSVLEREAAARARGGKKEKRRGGDEKWRRVSMPELGGVVMLGELLGKGAFGAVYKGLAAGTGDFVAVKRVALESTGMTEKRKAELAKEVALLRGLRHKNIVRFLHSQVDTESGMMQLVMEYCGGGSLAQVVRRFGVLPETLMAIYLDQVLAGLAYLHSEGVIHRDIKGGNILLTKDGLVKLADFGIATRLSDPSTSTRSIVGTPYWMAPEIIETKPPTTAADIWSLGCTVIELVSGRPPFYEFGPIPAMFKMVGEPHPPFPPKDTISPLLVSFLHDCFVREPPMRATARELCSHPWVVSCRKAAKSKADISEMHQTLSRISGLTEAQRASFAPPSASAYNSSIDEGNTIDMLNDVFDFLAPPSPASGPEGVEIYNVPSILADPELLEKSMAHSVRIAHAPTDGAGASSGKGKVDSFTVSHGSSGSSGPTVETTGGDRTSSMTLTIFECLKKLAESQAKIAALESYVYELESDIAAREEAFANRHNYYEDAVQLVREEAGSSRSNGGTDTNGEEVAYLQSRVKRLEESLKRALERGVEADQTIQDLTKERDSLRKEVGTLSFERQNMLSEVSSLSSAFRSSPLLRDRVMRRLSVDTGRSSSPINTRSSSPGGGTPGRHSPSRSLDGTSPSTGGSGGAGPYHWQVGVGEHSILPKEEAEPEWKRKLVDHLRAARARARVSSADDPRLSPRFPVLARFPPISPSSESSDVVTPPALAPKTRDQISSDFLSKLRFFREGEDADAPPVVPQPPFNA